MAFILIPLIIIIVALVIRVRAQAATIVSMYEKSQDAQFHQFDDNSAALLYAGHASVFLEILNTHVEASGVPLTDIQQNALTALLPYYETETIH